jgi:predicted dehydrogenase
LKRLGTAVVGLGVGTLHVQAYATLPESDLIAVCDANSERVRATADQYHVVGYTSVDDLLRDDRVEVVSIATPHPSHAPLAIQALASGRHVIVEKPMTINLAEADAMIATARHGRPATSTSAPRIRPTTRSSSRIFFKQSARDASPW